MGGPRVAVRVEVNTALHISQDRGYTLRHGHSLVGKSSLQVLLPYALSSDQLVLALVLRPTLIDLVSVAPPIRADAALSLSEQACVTHFHPNDCAIPEIYIDTVACDGGCDEATCCLPGKCAESVGVIMGHCVSFTSSFFGTPSGDRYALYEVKHLFVFVPGGNPTENSRGAAFASERVLCALGTLLNSCRPNC